MSELIDALLGQVNDRSIRAAISAGWELGKGLPRHRGLDTQLQRKIEKAVSQLSEQLDLDSETVYAAALLSMALNK